MGFLVEYIHGWYSTTSLCLACLAFYSPYPRECPIVDRNNISINEFLRRKVLNDYLLDATY
jgi:hypothetical protein